LRPLKKSEGRKEKEKRKDLAIKELRTIVFSFKKHSKRQEENL
jgi:hypothetical protein